MNQCEVAAGKDSELDRFTLKSILIVEEEFRIALDLQDTLVRAGYSDTNLCTSRAEALRSLSIRTPTVALLDVQLMDGSSADIAMERETRGVPFIVCSAWGKSEVPEVFRQNSGFPSHTGKTNSSPLFGTLWRVVRSRWELCHDRAWENEGGAVGQTRACSPSLFDAQLLWP